MQIFPYLDRYRRYLEPSALALLVLVAFYPALRYHFFDLDDSIHLFANPQMTRAGIWKFWVEPYHNLYIPLSYTLWAMLRGITWTLNLGPGGNGWVPELFHALSLCLHAVNSFLVYRILVAFRLSPLPCLFGALFFAVHPLQAQTVIWIACQRDLFAGLFALFGLLQIIHYARYPERVKVFSLPFGQQDRQLKFSSHYLLATVLFIAAMLCKPNAVAAPVIAFVILVLHFGRCWKQALRLSEPWIAAMLIITFATRSIQQLEDPVQAVSWWGRHRIAGDSLVFYLLKSIFPLQLVIDYGRHPAAVLAKNITHFVWLLPAGLIFWLSRTSARRPYLMAFLIFSCALLPTLGYLPFLYQKFSTVSDRYAYLALLGFSFAVASVLHQFSHRAVVLAATALLTFFTLVSHRATRGWENAEQVYKKAVSVNPGSHLAANNLGTYLMQRRRFEEASQYYELAVKGMIAAGHPMKAITSNWLQSLLKSRQFGRAALVLSGSKNNGRISPEQWNELGLYALRAKMAVEAELIFRYALQLEPKQTSTLNNLALALSTQGKMREAEAAYKSAIRIDPTDVASHHNLGTYYLRQNQVAQAKSAFEKAIAVNPRFTFALASLGEILLSQGKAAQAAHYLEKALQSAPHRENVRLELAGALLASKKNAKAIALLEEGVLKHPRNARMHFMLSQLYADGKKTDLARTHARTAIAIDPLWVRQEVLRQSQAQARLNAR